MALGLSDETIQGIKTSVKGEMGDIPVQIPTAVAIGNVPAVQRIRDTRNTVKVLGGTVPGTKQMIGRAAFRYAGPFYAVGAGIDAKQGRDAAFRIFGKNANMGQRAAAVFSNIANGISVGTADVANDKDIKYMYDYYAKKFDGS